MFGRRKQRAKGHNSTGAQASAADANAVENAGAQAGGAADAVDNDFDPNDGPFDRSAVKDLPQFYKKLGLGHLDLGAMALGVPPNAQVTVAIAQDKSVELHIVTEHCRIVPRAFSAPRTGGQWRDWMSSFRAQLDGHNADIRHEDGPWGRELVASTNGVTLRLIGVEGPRWMVEVRAISTDELAETAKDEARDFVGRMVIQRGTAPMPAGEHLPLEYPDKIAAMLQEALKQLDAQLKAQQQAPQQAQRQTQPPVQPSAPSQGTPSQGVANPAPPATSVPAAAPSDSAQRPRKRESAMNRLRDMDTDQ